MSSKRRTRHELLVETLTVCLKPATVNEILQTVKTSGTVIYKLLGGAQRFKLIDYAGGKYHTTGKGKGFLQAWDNVIDSFLKE